MRHKDLREQVEEMLLSSYETMYRIAFTYVQNEDDALDIVQESAYKAIKNSKSIKQERYMKTWILKIVINTSIDFLKKKKRELLKDNIEELDCEAVTDEYLDFDTIQALNVLNEKEKAVIILRFFEEKKLEEIAIILNSNLNTIKSLLYRSLKKLKIEIEKGDVRYEGIF
ncbi:MAG: sigma-70 family RNA polymerase sigma factor [Lachnospiraceae bacterium]|nr:sigma-70 family RNA polymerase sigma factor [Lachnospiraceae bacterium]